MVSPAILLKLGGQGKALPLREEPLGVSREVPCVPMLLTVTLPSPPCSCCPAQAPLALPTPAANGLRVASPCLPTSLCTHNPPPLPPLILFAETKTLQAP